MESEQIKSALTQYLDGIETLYELAASDEWRKWLKSPDAWLQYMVSNFTKEQQTAITTYVQQDDTQAYTHIQTILMDVCRNPQMSKEFKAMKEMVDKHGPMLKDDE